MAKKDSQKMESVKTLIIVDLPGVASVLSGRALFDYVAPVPGGTSFHAAVGNMQFLYTEDPATIGFIFNDDPVNRDLAEHLASTAGYRVAVVTQAPTGSKLPEVEIPANASVNDLFQRLHQVEWLPVLLPASDGEVALDDASSAPTTNPVAPPAAAAAPVTEVPAPVVTPEVVPAPEPIAETSAPDWLVGDDEAVETDEDDDVAPEVAITDIATPQPAATPVDTSSPPPPPSWLSDLTEPADEAAPIPAPEAPAPRPSMPVVDTSSPPPPPSWLSDLAGAAPETEVTPVATPPSPPAPAAAPPWEAMEQPAAPAWDAPAPTPPVDMPAAPPAPPAWDTAPPAAPEAPAPPWMESDTSMSPPAPPAPPAWSEAVDVPPPPGTPSGAPAWDMAPPAPASSEPAAPPWESAGVPAPPAPPSGAPMTPPWDSAGVPAPPPVMPSAPTGMPVAPPWESAETPAAPVPQAPPAWDAPPPPPFFAADQNAMPAPAAPAPPWEEQDSTPTPAPPAFANPIDLPPPPGDLSDHAPAPAAPAPWSASPPPPPSWADESPSMPAAAPTIPVAPTWEDTAPTMAPAVPSAPWETEVAAPPAPAWEPAQSFPAGAMPGAVGGPAPLPKWREVGNWAPTVKPRRRNPGEPIKIISVTVPKGGTGKTSSSVNGASLLASTGKRVLYVDANAQQADGADLLGIPASAPTIMDLTHGAITRERALAACVKIPGTENLSALLGPRDPRQANPLLLTPQVYCEAVDVLVNDFDYILIDGPIAEIFREIIELFILTRSDFILSAVTPDVKTVMNTYKWFTDTTGERFAGAAAYPADQIGWFLNRYEDDVAFDEADARASLRRPNEAEWRYLGKVPDLKSVRRAGNMNQVPDDPEYVASLADVLYNAIGDPALHELALAAGRKGGRRRGRK